jgi:DNA-binding NtrC family response regulator
MSSIHYLDGKRVLLVDDEPDVLESLEELLSMCHTTRAQNYEDACKCIDTTDFDIAVLDIMGVSGYELLERCAERKLTAVMLTARAVTAKDVAMSFHKGAAYFIPKEEMFRIAIFLEDILEAKSKGKNTWFRWVERLSSFAEKTFGKEFDKTDKDFLDKLIRY